MFLEEEQDISVIQLILFRFRLFKIFYFKTSIAAFARYANARELMEPKVVTPVNVSLFDFTLIKYHSNRVSFFCRKPCKLS